MRFYFFRRDNRHTGTKNFDADFAEGARRCNPVISLFAQRLEAQGKAFKVVITACMRKLLTILNTMLRNQTLWTEEIILKNP